ncbi:MAG: hypothetical protein KKF44_11450, partial [Nanoarchaeota archaeon]|nr:hypothetical protein [Nanoarchaeota archaeon]
MKEIFIFEDRLYKLKTIDEKRIQNNPLWIDYTDITQEEAEELKNLFELHPLTTEDLLSPDARIKVEEFPHYLFCVFYGILKNKETVELVEIDFILGKNFIISNHKKTLKSFTVLMDNTKKVEALLKMGPEFMMHRLLDMVVDNYSPMLEHFDDVIEDIEEEVVRSPRPDHLTQILKLKRLLVYIKRHIFQQREKISFLAKNDYNFIGKKARYYFRDIYDHAIMVSDSVDNYTVVP